MILEKVPRSNPDTLTGWSHDWDVTLADGQRIRWQGMYTGPRILTDEQIEEACQRLLRCDLAEAMSRANDRLMPANHANASLPALILHSSTPELKAFEGDLQALAQGERPGDLTTYKETRSVYLARPGDVAVGRTLPWRSAVQILGIEAIEISDIEHYYLSHALLELAVAHQQQTVVAIERLLSHLRQGARQIKLYALEPEMQIFLLWLAQTAGIGELAVEANRPALAAAWNRKSVLHPPVSRAAELPMNADRSPAQLLELEASQSDLTLDTGLLIPTVPGYTIEREGQNAQGFARQVEAAAHLLRQRYGLTTGCLKASEAGDGARIATGLPLADSAKLKRLSHAAFSHGDDYLLEAQVDYRRPKVAGHEVLTAISAHIRGGSLAAGATLQFVEGTSWKGNLFIDHETHDAFQVSSSHYHRSRRFVDEFLDYFQSRDPGLVLAGVDLAVGTVGGILGDQILLGVQDLNISFTGAECLRAFLDKARQGGALHCRYGVTRVYRPRQEGDHGAFLKVTTAARRHGVYADTVASLPGRWAMVGITGTDPVDALHNLRSLQNALSENGLIEPS